MIIRQPIHEILQGTKRKFASIHKIFFLWLIHVQNYYHFKLVQDKFWLMHLWIRAREHTMQSLIAV